MSIYSLRSIRKSQSDQELLINYRVNDDLDSLDELFQRYIHLVFSVCKKYLNNVDDSKDAVLEIFKKTIEDLKKYKVTNFKNGSIQLLLIIVIINY